MENTKNTLVMRIIMNINDTFLMYLNDVEIAKKHRESEEGEGLEYCLRLLNSIAKDLLDCHYYKNYCSRQNSRYFEFQCRSHEEYVIASYHRGDDSHLGMEQVEQFLVSMAVSELYTFICKCKACPVASEFENLIFCIFYHGMKTTWIISMLLNIIRGSKLPKRALIFC
jgi:hypothetical protein